VKQLERKQRLSVKAANSNPPAKAGSRHPPAKAASGHPPVKAVSHAAPARAATINAPAKAANSNPLVKAVGGTSHVKAVGGTSHVKPVSSNPPPVKAAASIAPVKAGNGKRKLEFSPADFVVYPTHGVGRIVKVEQREISGFKLDLFVIEFEKDRMTLRVPVGKAGAVGMRRLSSPQTMRSALETLKGRARIKRTMWSRRAQEYEAKINSGNPISIAEVLRDLHRNAGQPDQSYSERQIYEAALDRLARELAAVERIDEESATKRLEKVLQAA
jgi:CarD family transcriptional regulator